MSGKNRDMQELLQYYKDMLEFGEQVSRIGKRLQQTAEDSTRLLADDVSLKTIRKVRDGAGLLQTLGDHVTAEIRPEAEKAIRDIDRFSQL